jgi:hypothetical protein
MKYILMMSTKIKAIFLNNHHAQICNANMNCFCTACMKIVLHKSPLFPKLKGYRCDVQGIK